MKKFASLLILVAIFTAAFFYFNNTEDSSEDITSRQKSDGEEVVVEFEDQAAQKVGSKKSADTVQANDSQSSDSKEGLVVQTDEELEKRLEAKEEEFDRLEEAWLNDVKELFLNDLGLTESEYKDYLNMRDGLFNDKIDAFEDMHDQLEQKYGENYSYNPTEEEMAFDREIQKKYDELLLRKLGEDGFRKYLELRDRTNEKILESTKQDDAALIMEF